MSWLSRCLSYVLLDGDDAYTVFKKKVLIATSFASFLISGTTMIVRNAESSLLMLPMFVGSCVLLGSLVVTKQVHNLVVEVIVYFDFLAVILNDWHAAKTLTMRLWPGFIILLDIAHVFRLQPRVSRRIVCLACMWFVLTLTEDAYRWGLYDVPIDDKHRTDQYNCAHPPCASGVAMSISTTTTALLIFLLDFYFTRGFAHGLGKQNDKVNAAIAATEHIATSLAVFDLTSAETVLSTVALPRRLHDALQRVLTNLELYRPYLPDALFAEMHSYDICNVQAPGLDTGTATLVFTDIQGSTATWEACPDGMSKGLQVHNAVIRECLTAHGGYEVKTIGDSFMVAFENAAAAVQFSLAVQIDLVHAMWPAALSDLEHLRWIDEGPWCGLRVRVGVHCGEVDVQLNPLTGRYDYFGNTVNKAARMEGACVGGAVAVTQEVLAEVGELPGVTLIDMGELELKGVHDGVKSYLLLPESLEGRRGYVEGQLHLKRNERKLMKMRAVSDDSSDPGSDPAGQRKVSVHLQQRVSATVGVVEAVMVSSEVAVVTELMNSVLGRVVTSSERTHGTVVSLQGSRVAVSWNAAKVCSTHVENSLMFVRNMDADHDIHIGLGTSTAAFGTVGCRRQKFVAVLGIGMEVASKLCTDASQSDALCFYASNMMLSNAAVGGLMLSIKKLGTYEIPGCEAMYLYEVTSDFQSGVTAFTVPLY